MKPIFIALIAAVAVVVSSGAVVADTEETPTPEAESEATVHVDSDVRVSEWSFSDGEFHLELEADRPKVVTMTESIQQVEGATSISIEEQRVLTGTNEVVVPVEPAGGEAALIISTSESLDNGEATVISTGINDGSLPFAGTSATMGWVGGAATVMFLFAVVAYRAKRKEPDHPRRAD